jgi:hypothetical protein
VRRTGISFTQATAPIAARMAPPTRAVCIPLTNDSAEPCPRAAEPGISAPKRATPTAIPAWRNVSFTPAASPLISCGAHDEVAVASRPSASPIATNASPTAISAPAETFWSSPALAPDTKKISTVQGR